MKVIIMSLIALVLITGCAATKQVVVETAYLEAVARAGNTQPILKTAELTDFELMELTHAFNELGKFRAKWKAFLQDPVANIHVISLDELDTDFAKVKYQYQIAFNVAANNWSEYDNADRAHMLRVHEHAEKLDQAVEDLKEEGEWIDAIKEAVHYVEVVAAIAVSFK
jgi:hypothetical protein